jgi:hypothetical protein
VQVVIAFAEQLLHSARHTPALAPSANHLHRLLSRLADDDGMEGTCSSAEVAGIVLLTGIALFLTCVQE